LIAPERQQGTADAPAGREVGRVVHAIESRRLTVLLPDRVDMPRIAEGIDLGGPHLRRDRPRIEAGAVAGVVGNRGGVVSGLFNEP
jgi:hypothetical protein